MNRTLLPALALAALLSGPAQAEDGHMNHAGMMQHDGHEQLMGSLHQGMKEVSKDAVTAASEPGQGAFAAIGEIVEILQADPGTDWTRVDIDGLRAHLADMANVTLHASVSASQIEDGYAFAVTGEGAVAASIRSMVTAHAAMMDGAAGIALKAEETADGAVLTARSSDPDVRAKIRGLGFFGLMTTGMHHQSHHLAMARGDNPHH